MVITKAHITRLSDGTVISQTVAEHCKNTAEYAEEIMKKVNLPTVGYITGLSHDMGKNKRFEDYLERAFAGEEVRRGSVNHTFAGVIEILRKFHNSNSVYSLLLSEIVGFGIGAHHAMFDMGTADRTKPKGIEYRFNYDTESIEYDDVLRYFYNEVCTDKEFCNLWEKATNEFGVKFSALSQNVKAGYYGKQNATVIGFYIQCLMRHLLSAVVEGDRRDTQEFMEQKPFPNNKMDWDMNLAYFNQKLDNLPAETHISQVRRRISDILYNGEAKSEGIYLLTLPTGSGKTLSSVRYALKIAKEYKKERIFYVAPLLSILHQNSEVIRDYIKETDKVLEHYSDAITLKNNNSTEFVDYNIRKHYINTWDSPFIITTLFQLLETFFKEGMKQVRRFNKLADSVLIIDEVQQIPLASIQLFNLMINYLADFCGVTVILMTATQPHFEMEMLKYPVYIQGDLTKQIESEINLEAEFGNRVQYDVDIKPIDYAQQVKMLASLCEKHNSVLLVCNTRSSCRVLYDMCEVSIPNVKLYRLSRNMCEAEIADTIKDLRKALDNGEKVLCISTQLIEAGVDIDFETVVRASAGLDNVVQTAGRCNRHNKREKGTVYVRKLVDENIDSLEAIYKAQIAFHATAVSNQENFKITDELCRQYYTKYYSNLQESLNSGTIGRRLVDDASSCDFTRRSVFHINNLMKTFGERYKVYDTGTQYTVLIPYGKYEADVLSLKSITDVEVLAQKLKKLGSVCVTLYETALNRYKAKGIINEYVLDNQYTFYISEVVDFEGNKE